MCCEGGERALYIMFHNAEEYIKGMCLAVLEIVSSFFTFLKVILECKNNPLQVKALIQFFCEAVVVYAYYQLHLFCSKNVALQKKKSLQGPLTTFFFFWSFQRHLIVFIRG